MLDVVSHMAGPGVSLASRFREFVSVSGTLPQSGLVSKYFGHATFPGPQSSGQDLVTSTHRVSSRASQCRPGPQRFLQITPASFGQVGSFFFSVCFSFNVVAHPRSVDASSWHPVVLIPMAAARGPKGPPPTGRSSRWHFGCQVAYVSFPLRKAQIFTDTLRPGLTIHHDVTPLAGQEFSSRKVVCGTSGGWCLYPRTFRRGL